jgi:UDP-2-acetamido-3-amino-2,3-dideoxy-glucuronate N-acetyltransferase
VNFIHPSAVLSRYTEVGENVLIGPNCSIGFPGFQFYQQEDEPLDTIIGNGTIIMGNSVICAGARIGDNCRLDYHSYIGEQSIVGDYCVVEYGARIYDGVVIKNGTTISGFVCNHSSIGSNSVVQGDLVHKFRNAKLDEEEPAPVVGDGCFIGRKALIIGGITVADGSYISAGAVVIEDTRPNKLYVGSPAIEAGIAPKSYIEGVSAFNRKRINKIHETIDRYTWT